MIEMLNRWFSPWKRRIQSMIGRCLITLMDDSKGFQICQAEVLADEVRDGMERYQNYGFSSVPLKGAEGVILFPGGDRSHGIVIVVEDPINRPTGLASGEVVIYTDEGDEIRLKRGKIMEITTNTLRINAATKVEINSPLVEVNG